jgi:hypothetical protein
VRLRFPPSAPHSTNEYGQESHILISSRSRAKTVLAGNWQYREAFVWTPSSSALASDFPLLARQNLMR